MAREIRYHGRASQTGLTLTATVYDDQGAVHTSGIAMTEIGATSVYYCDMPTADAGAYFAQILNGTTRMGGADLMWDGAREVTEHHLGRLIGNRRQTDPTTGKEQLFDDDDVTVLLEGDLYEDVAGGTPYSGTSTGADRRDRLQTP